MMKFLKYYLKETGNKNYLISRLLPLLRLLLSPNFCNFTQRHLYGVQSDSGSCLEHVNAKIRLKAVVCLRYTKLKDLLGCPRFWHFSSILWVDQVVWLRIFDENSHSLSYQLILHDVGSCRNSVWPNASRVYCFLFWIHTSIF